jgi:micrococcal nuclease
LNAARQVSRRLRRTTFTPVLAAAFLGVLGLVFGESEPFYRTRTGEKYHRASCSALSASKIPVSAAEIVRLGLAPCGICAPPDLRAGAPAASDGLYHVERAALARYQDADVSRMLIAKVTRHVDGDTVRLEFDSPPPRIQKSETVRLIGVDTPETVHPRRGLEFFGKEASDFTKKALLGKTVYAAFDWDLRDKYGRLLVYLYTAPGICHNAELIKQGYAHAYTRFPFQFLEEFRLLEEAARKARRGFWARYG